MREVRRRLRATIPSSATARVGMIAAVVALVGPGLYFLTDGAASASPVSTVTTLVSGINPSVSGEQVTFTAMVAEVPSGAVPTGMVQFAFRGYGDICVGGVDLEPLSGGEAQCTTSSLMSGVPSAGVIATYQGDTSDAASYSPVLAQSVTTGSTATAITSTAVFAPVTESSCVLSSGSLNVTGCSSLIGVTPGASVADTGGAVPGGDTIATLNKSTGVITLSLAASASTTESLTFVDNPGDGYSSGRPARFSATVTAVSPSSGTPTGTVAWTITGAAAQSVACSNGISTRLNHSSTATCVVPQGQLVSAGAPYTVAATYSGDPNFASSTETAHQAINPSSSKTFLAGSPMPPLRGTPVHFTASVVPSADGVNPTGVVTFSFTSTPFTLSNCTLGASSTRVTCSAGVSSVIAGDQVRDLTTPADIPSGTSVSSVGGNAVTLSNGATVSATGQSLAFTPTSTPTIICDGASNSVPLTPSGATCTITGGLPFAGSPFSVVARYSGDLNDGASVSHALSVRVH